MAKTKKITKKLTRNHFIVLFEDWLHNADDYDIQCLAADFFGVDKKSVEVDENDEITVTNCEAVFKDI